MATVQELLRSAGDLPGEEALRDGEILLGHCLRKSRAWLYTWPEREVPADMQLEYEGMLARRSSGEPVAYIIGHREFWSLDLAVNEHTLIPRPETETLVQWALELDLAQDARVLDLGTGSGAIALALAAERQLWDVTAVDASPEALATASENGRASALHRVRFVLSDWFQAVGEEAYHLIVSNPPYVDPADPHLALGDLPYEPSSALVAEEGGLADLYRIIDEAPGHLLSGGWLLLEHGFEQGAPVRAALCEAGFKQVSTRLDLAGLERISGGQWHAQ